MDRKFNGRCRSLGNEDAHVAEPCQQARKCDQRAFSVLDGENEAARGLHSFGQAARGRPAHKRVPENAMPNGVRDAARRPIAGRSWPAAPPLSPLDPFSDNRVATRDSRMTRWAVGTPCSSPSDGVITPPSGEPPGPSASGGHEQPPGLATARLTFVFQPGRFRPPRRTASRNRRLELRHIRAVRRHARRR